MLDPQILELDRRRNVVLADLDRALDAYRGRWSEQLDISRAFLGTKSQAERDALADKSRVVDRIAERVARSVDRHLVDAGRLGLNEEAWDRHDKVMDECEAMKAAADEAIRQEMKRRR